MATLIQNLELLFPIFPSVMIVVANSFDELDIGTQELVHSELRRLVSEGSHLCRVDLNLAYLIRVLGKKNTVENSETLQRLYSERTASFIRRDIILIMAKWRNWYWLSDIKNRFRTLSTAERRAFVIASYALGDEGRHWRDHTRDEFTLFEIAVRDWAASKVNQPKWSIPI